MAENTRSNRRGDYIRRDRTEEVQVICQWRHIERERYGAVRETIRGCDISHETAALCFSDVRQTLRRPRQPYKIPRFLCRACIGLYSAKKSTIAGWQSEHHLTLPKASHSHATAELKTPAPSPASPAAGSEPSPAPPPGSARPPTPGKSRRRLGLNGPGGTWRC